MKAESKAVKTGQPADYSKCDQKITFKFGNAESKWGAECPTSGDVGTMQSVVTDATDDWAILLSGGTLPGCGDGVQNGDEQCDGVDLGGASCASLGFNLDGTLGCTAACQFDVSACENQAFPATGQTTCYDSSGSVIACAGTGHDGDVQAGAALSYTDNGDGTVTDDNTGLMWEKKSDDGSIHDKDNTYDWDDAFAVHVATLNSNVFAGYTDWRVPNVKELQSIVDYETFSPAVDAAFHNGCVAACAVTTCSCTSTSSFYWSSTSVAVFPDFAWFVE
jgi:hypothetical protein